MPRVSVPVTEIEREGVSIATEAATVAVAADDHEVPGGADGLTILLVENTHGSLARSATITPKPTLALDGLTVNPLTVGPIPAGETWIAGVYRTSTFTQDSTNLLYLNVEEDTDLEFRAFRVVLPS